MHCLQQAKFARHVVRARRDRPERRTTQHELAVAKSQQVCEIRVAARKLFDPHRRAAALRKRAAKIIFEARPFELLARADGLRINGHPHFILTSLETMRGKKRFSGTAHASFPPMTTSSLRFATASTMRSAHSSGRIASSCVSSIFPNAVPFPVNALRDT